jgi:hypothetical protein
LSKLLLHHCLVLLTGRFMFICNSNNTETCFCNPATRGHVASTAIVLYTLITKNLQQRRFVETSGEVLVFEQTLHAWFVHGFPGLKSKPPKAKVLPHLKACMVHIGRGKPHSAGLRKFSHSMFFIRKQVPMQKRFSQRVRKVYLWALFAVALFYGGDNGLATCKLVYERKIVVCRPQLSALQMHNGAWSAADSASRSAVRFSCSGCRPKGAPPDTLPKRPIFFFLSYVHNQFLCSLTCTNNQFFSRTL